MTGAFVALVFLLLLVLLVFLFNKPKAPELAYRPLQLMTNAEVRFYERLTEVVDGDFVMVQVQLSRVIAAHHEQVGGSEANRQRLRIAQMSLDYLLVDSDMQTVLLGIELDDWSHERPDRIRSDEKKNEAMSVAQLPLIRFHGEQMPEALQIKTALRIALKDYLKASPGRTLVSSGWAHKLLADG